MRQRELLRPALSYNGDSTKFVESCLRASIIVRFPQKSKYRLPHLHNFVQIHTLCIPFLYLLPFSRFCHGFSLFFALFFVVNGQFFAASFVHFDSFSAVFPVLFHSKIAKSSRIQRIFCLTFLYPRFYTLFCGRTFL